MEKDEALIEVVRDYQCLYNSKSADFKVVLKKENVWTAIATKLNRTGEVSCFYIGYTYNMRQRVTFVIFIVSDCKARWKALRERFVKEVKNLTSGQGAAVYTPWELLNHMRFIQEFIKHRK